MCSRWSWENLREINILISISMTDLSCGLLSVNDDWVRLVLAKTNMKEELPGFSSTVCLCDEHFNISRADRPTDFSNSAHHLCKTRNILMCFILNIL